MSLQFQSTNYINAENICDSYRKGVDLNPSNPYLSTREFKAIVLTETFLAQKKITIPNLRSEEFRRFVNIAWKLDKISEIALSEDKKIALEMKDLLAKAVEYRNQEPSLTARASNMGADVTSILSSPPVKLAIFLTKAAIRSVTTEVAVPITPQDIEAAYPDGVPLENALELLDMQLDKEATAFLLKQFSRDLLIQKQVMNDLVKNLARLEARSNEMTPPTHHTQIQNQEVTTVVDNQGIVEAQSSEMTPNQEVVANNADNREAQSSERASQTEIKGVDKDLGKQLAFAKQIAGVIFYYHQLDSNYSEQRKHLSRAFEQICESFDFRVTLQQFRSKSYDEIVHSIAKQYPSQSPIDRIILLRETTAKISEESDRLIGRINHCLEKKGYLEGSTAAHQNLYRDLKGFYNRDLKKLQMATRVVGACQVAFTVASFIPGLGLPAQIALGVAQFGIQIGGQILDSKKNKQLNKASTLLESGQGRAHTLGMLTKENLNELLCLQETKRDELGYLMANRHYIKPSVYKQKLDDLTKWIADDQKNLANEQGKLIDTKIRLEREISKLKSDLFFEDDKKKKAKMNIQKKDKEFELQLLNDKKTEIENNKKKDEKLSRDLEVEKNITKYVAPLSKYREDLMNQQQIPDETTRRWREEFGQYFSELHAVRMEGYAERLQLYEALNPIVGGLQFLSRLECMKDSGIGSFLGKTPDLLKLVREIDSFRHHADSLISFKNTVDKLMVDYDDEIKGDIFKLIEKIGYSKVLTQAVLPLCGVVGAITSIGMIIYHLNYPQKDPTIEAMQKMMEQMVKAEQELIGKLLENLTRQNEQIFNEIKESTMTICAHMERGNDRVVSHIDGNLFYQFEAKITALLYEFEKSLIGLSGGDRITDDR